jgi:hypothetical protein
MWLGQAWSDAVANVVSVVDGVPDASTTAIAVVEATSSARSPA